MDVLCRGVAILYEMFQDVRASRDFIDHDSDPTPTGSDSHGTACAGVIGMARNGVCGVGVAPGTSLGGKYNSYTCGVSIFNT